MFAEDLTAFFQADEHATEALLDFLPVVGIFHKPYAEAFDGIASSGPRFTLPSAAAASATQESQLRIGDDLYAVRSVQPDGTGITVLTLQTAL